MSNDKNLGQHEETISLLRKLASDDDVRARFMTDTKSVLEEFGIEHEDSDIPATVSLPDKEALNAELAKLEEGLKSGNWGLIPFLVIALR